MNIKSKLIGFAALLVVSVQFMPSNLLTVQAEEKTSDIVTGTSVCYGDVNCDNIIDSADYSLLRKYMLGQISSFPVPDGVDANWGIKAADVNIDSCVDSADYTLLRSYLLGKNTHLPYSDAVIPFSVNLTADKASPQKSGTKIKISSNVFGASGLVNYAWEIYQGDILIERDNDPTLSWTPTHGNYTIKCTVTDESGKSSTALMPYSIKNSRIFLTASIQEESPKSLGTPINIHFTSSGTTGTPTYFFQINKGSGWEGFNVNSSPYTWNPIAEGEYTLKLGVEDDLETEAVYFSYKVTSKLNAYLISDLASPQISGTKINLIGNSDGESEYGSVNYTYEFYRDNLLIGSAKGANYIWEPTAGNYTIKCIAKDSKTDSRAETTISYKIKPRILMSMTIQESSPQILGTPVHVYYSSNNATGEVYHSFDISRDNGNTWENIPTTIGLNNVTWTPSAPGNYILRVLAEDDLGIEAKYEAFVIN